MPWVANVIFNIKATVTLVHLGVLQNIKAVAIDTDIGSVLNLHFTNVQ